LKEALKLLDVQGFVAAIGDSEIDQELLEAADFRAAVADGDPEVKRIADYVAKKKDGEGVMEVIDLLLSLELPLFFRLF
ncbi:MAG: HAD hydrolase family protein, partial [Nitrososphaerota archaeon]